MCSWSHFFRPFLRVRGSHDPPPLLCATAPRERPKTLHVVRPHMEAWAAYLAGERRDLEAEPLRWGAGS